MSPRCLIPLLLLAMGCRGRPESPVLAAAREEAAAGRLQHALELVDAQLALRPDALALRRERVVIFLQAGQFDAVEQARAGLPEDRPVLVEALSHPNADVRANAAQLLADQATPDQLRLFIRGADSRDAAVRQHCARALGRLRDQRGIRPLFRLLRDGYWMVRAEAVDALAELGDPRAAGWLVRSLRDSDGYVRFRASVALRRLACPANHAALLTGLDWVGTEAGRLEVAAALNQLGDSVAFGPLMDAARSSDAPVRRRAAQLIGEAGWQAATNLLERLSGDEDASVRDQVERSRALLRRLSGSAEQARGGG